MVTAINTKIPAFFEYPQCIENNNIENTLSHCMEDVGELWVFSIACILVLMMDNSQRFPHLHVNMPYELRKYL